MISRRRTATIRSMPRRAQSRIPARDDAAARLWWGVLLVLLAALLLGALTFDRRTWGALVGDEVRLLEKKGGKSGHYTAP